MSRISRKPVPQSRQNSVIQEPDQPQSSRVTSYFGAIGPEAAEVPTKTHELTGSQHTKLPARTNTVEDFSDDDESLLDPGLGPPPVYQPSEVDINQEGLHARATAACEFPPSHIF